MTTQAVYAAASLGVLGKLSDVPLNVDALALATGTEREALRRLLRALTLFDVARVDARGRFTLGPLGRGISHGGLDDDSHWRSVAPIGHPYVRAWSELPASVRTGETAFDRVHGMPLFDYLRKNPDTAEEFNAAMARRPRSGERDAAVTTSYRAPSGSLVIDVGGGTGSLLAALLAENVDARGILVDLPHVAAAAREIIARKGLAKRVEVVGADIFTNPLPDGGDVYLLASVLHDWRDDQARAILRAVRAAMPLMSVLLVVEPLMPDGKEPFYGALLDLEMLVMTGGRERTQAEYERLLTDSGFTRFTTRPTASMWSILEAFP